MSSQSDALAVSSAPGPLVTPPHASASAPEPKSAQSPGAPQLTPAELNVLAQLAAGDDPEAIGGSRIAVIASQALVLNQAASQLPGMASSLSTLASAFDASQGAPTWITALGAALGAVLSSTVDAPLADLKSRLDAVNTEIGCLKEGLGKARADIERLMTRTAGLVDCDPASLCRDIHVRIDLVEARIVPLEARLGEAKSKPKEEKTQDPHKGAGGRGRPQSES
jgi:hypothetical protein